MIGMHQEVIATSVQYDVTSHYNATLNKTNRTLHDHGKTVSPGLAKRLAHYARKRLTEGGFGAMIAGWTVHVEAMSIYSVEPEDQTYCVQFRNDQGGSIGIEGIMTLRGWPTLDHGPCIDL
jgi:hypothetical protein